MPRLVLCVLVILTTLGIPAAAADDTNVVFRSDVSLVRVDAQVVDRSNRVITGLKIDDFVLLEDGQKMTIRNFESEDMPVDILLLLDVSGSMQPHIERLSNAAHQALQVLGKGDRVAVMVFDRQSRLRMPFRNNLDVIEQELENVLRQETFDGGTDITRGMLDAANYIGKEGRKDARRAIVILTDDQTEREREDQTVLSALNRADTVMSALIAPDAMHGRYGGRGGSGGGGWPRSGGGGNWPSGAVAARGRVAVAEWATLAGFLSSGAALTVARGLMAVEEVVNRGRLSCDRGQSRPEPMKLPNNPAAIACGWMTRRHSKPP